MSRPNVVIFNPDQWRGDVLGHLGNPGAVTPNLDAMVAQDGVSFSQAFCQNTVCTPSRCSFMTGWYPHVRGHRTMYHMLQPDEPMLLRTLKEAGYTVWWGGKNDVVPAQNGYGTYCDVKYRPVGSRPSWDLEPERAWRGEPGNPRYHSFFRGVIDLPAGEERYYDSDWANVEGAIDWTRQRDPDSGPFCLYLALTYPHPPYAVEKSWRQQIDAERVPARRSTPDDWSEKSRMMASIYRRQQLQELTNEEWRELRAVYYAMCTRVDDQFGRLVQALKGQGLYENTAIFVFSDHGDFTGDYGLVEKAQNCMEDSLTRVPLVIKPPRGFAVQAGVRSDLVELIDVPATIEAMTGVQPNHRHFGRSLLPLIAGQPDPSTRDAVFCEGGRLAGESEAMEKESVEGMPRPEDSLYWPRLSVQYEDDVAHSKAIMCRTSTHKYVYRLLGRDELYDLLKDPEEEQNRISDQAYEPIRRQMEHRVLQFLTETVDVVRQTPDRRM